VTIPDGARRTLSRDEGLSTRYAGLPAGAECTLTEPRTGRADGTTITPNDGDPAVGALTVEEGAVVTLDVENRFGPVPPDGEPPSTSSGSSSSPSSGSSSGSLPDTGLSRAAELAAVAAVLLLLAGGALLVLARRGASDVED
jgi:LPXTG-motif cell wall-anchored protein